MKRKIKKRTISAIFAVILMLTMLIGVTPMTVFAEEECAHTNTIYTAPVGEPSCFEPAMGGYWFCEVVINTLMRTSRTYIGMKMKFGMP